MSAAFDDLADRLDALAEDLAEAAIGELKSALNNGGGKRPATEKALTQARRAVEKASFLLRSIDEPTSADEHHP